MFTIEPITDIHRAFVDQQIVENWAGPFIVTRGRLFDIRTNPGFVAMAGGQVAGYVLYWIEDGQCEVTVLESLRENRGIGGAMINAVIEAAKDMGCRRVWLATTNDNVHAIRFYQKFGFSLCAVHIDAIAEARKLKPQIPTMGIDGIPIEHEFEFEIIV